MVLRKMWKVYKMSVMQSSNDCFLKKNSLKITAKFSQKLRKKLRSIFLMKIYPEYWIGLLIKRILHLIDCCFDWNYFTVESNLLFKKSYLSNIISKKYQEFLLILLSIIFFVNSDLRNIQFSWFIIFCKIIWTSLII